ncbi:MULTISPECIES: helix-turn-helix transcriptional regulator [unclassified Nocardioides]|uniref:helix-turn-helix transcriptional regulator n=1 Tax=unclassified Nocardioides TaxID=2615069 RepID=UPI0006F838B8|nr:MULTISPECIES: WYL domain-containing protein [unclassified Nocardioides]KRA28146.1 transcriptional regulator [Nocardioides sp. Root614]KRA86120.1 transcriptional regulator [Nocardioides sp. Root682]
MPAPKSERLLNLLIMLLVQRRPIAKDRIRELLYPDSRPDAFEKMFERDKDELRSLGVPVEVASIDPLFEDEVGYRIPPEAFALPDIELTSEEAAVVGIASRVWQHATMAQATTDAVRKLSAAGIDVDLDALEIAQPLLTAEEPAFETCWVAVCERTAIEFDYKRPGADSALTRHVQPWGVVRYSGRWYVVGHDADRGAERVFRLSRVQGPVRTVGPPGAYDVPPDTDVREIARRLAPPTGTEHAVLLVRHGAGHAFRRTADRIESGVTGPDHRSAWDRVEITRPAVGLADDVLAQGADVVLLEPVAIRQRIIARLEQVGR